ncbi:MAG: polysaccharide deacetylase family protein [Pseudoxanthomonas sp.]|nr:polysaccharide deacetylase family protein [Pseudoxanthomonas sp.]
MKPGLCPRYLIATTPRRLDRYDAQATFFRVANRAAAHPELAREIQRRGHGVDNHAGLEIWRV